jgi:hypothetical protein
MKNTLTFEDL